MRLKWDVDASPPTIPSSKGKQLSKEGRHELTSCHNGANCSLDRPRNDGIGEQFLDHDRVVANSYRVLSRQLSGRTNLISAHKEVRRLSLRRRIRGMLLKGRLSFLMWRAVGGEFH